MAKTGNNKTRGISLIELLNKAAASDTAMSSGEVKSQIGEIKKQVRKNNSWQRKFSKLLEQNPNWVELAEQGICYYVDKNCREKGVFPIVRNDMALLKVVM